MSIMICRVPRKVQLPAGLEETLEHCLHLRTSQPPQLHRVYLDDVGQRGKLSERFQRPEDPRQIGTQPEVGGVSYEGVVLVRAHVFALDELKAHRVQRHAVTGIGVDLDVECVERRRGETDESPRGEVIELVRVFPVECANGCYGLFGVIDGRPIIQTGGVEREQSGGGSKGHPITFFQVVGADHALEPGGAGRPRLGVRKLRLIGRTSPTVVAPLALLLTGELRPMGRVVWRRLLNHVVFLSPRSKRLLLLHEPWSPCRSWRP
jgi:hypothetical protein